MNENNEIAQENMQQNSSGGQKTANAKGLIIIIAIIAVVIIGYFVMQSFGKNGGSSSVNLSVISEKDRIPLGFSNLQGKWEKYDGDIKYIINFKSNNILEFTQYDAAGNVTAESDTGTYEAKDDVLYLTMTSGGGVSAKTEISHYFGFWLVLICFIVLTVLSVIQLLNLKGNKFFDSINGDSSDSNNTNTSSNTNADNKSNGGAPNLSFNADKLKGMAQNAASNISNAAGGIKNQVGEKIVQFNIGGSNAGDRQQNGSYQQAADPVRKGDPEEIMKQIKGLHEMKEAGILTEEEFNEKKQEFLKKM